jgi:type IV pilus assembly protein PilC
MSDIIVLDNESPEAKKKIIQSKTILERIDEFLMSHQSIGIKQKVIFYRLLSTMVNAGISIMKGIAILQKQEKNPLLIKFYEYVTKSIREGKSLSVAMREYGSTFSDSECSIVESGEKTGKLNSALTQLAEQVEKVASISTKIRGALMYPIAIIIVMCIAVGVLMIAVVPKIVEIF